MNPERQPAPPPCCCIENGQDPVQFYWVKYPLICIAHGIVPPQTARWMRRYFPDVEGPVYSEGKFGPSKIGKSHLSNESGENATAFARRANHARAPARFELFEVSNLEQEKTKGIDVVAVPRYCDANGRQLAAQNGIFLFFDGEGGGRGNTAHHAALVCIIAQICTYLNVVEGPQFNFRCLETVSHLIVSAMIVGRRASPVQPHLSFVLNQSTLQLSAGQTPESFWRSHFENHPGDVVHNEDRRLIREFWMQRGNASYGIIPLDPARTMPPGIIEALPEAARAALRANYLNALNGVLSDSYRHTLPFTIEYGRGTHAVNAPGVFPCSPAIYAEFVIEFIAACAPHIRGDPVQTPVVPVSIVHTIRERLIQSAKSEAVNRYTLRQQNDFNLRRGVNDYDGGKGFLADAERDVAWNAVRRRHDELVVDCGRFFHQLLQPQLNETLDPGFANRNQALANINVELARHLTRHEAHFNHMRAPNPAQTPPPRERTVVVKGPYEEFSHEMKPHAIDGAFGKKTAYFFNVFEDRQTEIQHVIVRNNGDRIEGPWIPVGVPVKVLLRSYRR